MIANFRRAPIRGFVGSDGRTHAVDSAETLMPAARAQCEYRSFASDTVPFIANPRAPLCLACITAIESTVKGKP